MGMARKLVGTMVPHRARREELMDEAGAAILGGMANELNALLNRVAGLEQQLGGVPGVLSQIANEMNAQHNLTTLLSINIEQLAAKLDVPSASGDPATALLAAGLTARSTAVHPAGAVAQPRAVDMDEELQKLAALDPKIFPHWQRLFDNAVSHYHEDIEASASVWGHRFAQLFGAFVSVYARGDLLDVGCGVNGKPSYLGGHPSRLVAGLEPLPQTSNPDFLCVRGFNEFIPWPDRCFDTVISGTSLDHVLSIDKSLAEVARVLRPGGRYLIWLASIAGAKPYAPDAPDFAPADQFHLFHFDRKWIEPLFARTFDFIDVTIIPQPGFDHVFYCLTPKQSSGP